MCSSIPAAVPAGLVFGSMKSKYWFMEWPDGQIDGLETPEMMTAEEAMDYMIDRWGLQPESLWPCQKWQLYASMVDIY